MPMSRFGNISTTPASISREHLHTDDTRLVQCLDIEESDGCADHVGMPSDGWAQVASNRDFSRRLHEMRKTSHAMVAKYRHLGVSLVSLVLYQQRVWKHQWLWSRVPQGATIRRLVDSDSGSRLLTLSFS